jgi:hypothetical protein
VLLSGGRTSAMAGDTFAAAGFNCIPPEREFDWLPHALPGLQDRQGPTAEPEERGVRRRGLQQRQERLRQQQQQEQQQYITPSNALRLAQTRGAGPSGRSVAAADRAIGTSKTQGGGGGTVASGADDSAKGDGGSHSRSGSSSGPGSSSDSGSGGRNGSGGIDDGVGWRDFRIAIVNDVPFHHEVTLGVAHALQGRRDRLKVHTPRLGTNLCVSVCVHVWVHARVFVRWGCVRVRECASGCVCEYVCVCPVGNCTQVCARTLLGSLGSRVRITGRHGVCLRPFDPSSHGPFHQVPPCPPPKRCTSTRASSRQTRPAPPTGCSPSSAASCPTPRWPTPTTSAASPPLTWCSS